MLFTNGFWLGGWGMAGLLYEVIWVGVWGRQNVVCVEARELIDHVRVPKISALLLNCFAYAF